MNHKWSNGKVTKLPVAIEEQIVVRAQIDPHFFLSLLLS